MFCIALHRPVSDGLAQRCLLLGTAVRFRDLCEIEPNRPNRPIMTYHGGKWRLADWIIFHFPPHCLYVEPFGGAASVLMKKPRSLGEVYNDLDDEIVNVMRVLQDATLRQQLAEVLSFTPYARAEFKRAKE